MALPRKRKGRGNHVVVPFPLSTSIGSYLRASAPPQTSSLLFQPLQPHNSIACLVAPPDLKFLKISLARMYWPAIYVLLLLI